MLFIQSLDGIGGAQLLLKTLPGGLQGFGHQMRLERGHKMRQLVSHYLQVPEMCTPPEFRSQKFSHLLQILVGSLQNETNMA